MNKLDGLKKERFELEALLNKNSSNAAAQALRELKPYFIKIDGMKIYYPVVSSSKCNTRLVNARRRVLCPFDEVHKDLQRRFEPQSLPRPGIELEGDGIQLFLAEHG